MPLAATLPILVDVGGVYDVATKRFDHHQRSFVDTFDDKHEIRLSSAGARVSSILHAKSTPLPI